eukprot:1029886-Pyramimonas_sp.AAC.1
MHEEPPAAWGLRALCRDTVLPGHGAGMSASLTAEGNPSPGESSVVLNPLEPLPPLTLEQLDRVPETYSSTAGLGWDKLHPRQLLWLPPSYSQAFQDILHAWERRPRSVDLWTLLVFFNSKPTGG